MRLQLHVERVEDDARLHRRRAGIDIDLEHAAQVLGGVDDEPGAGRLPALARAGAARQHRHAELACDLERDRDVVVLRRHEHADRHHLVDRGVGRIPAARGRVEHHLARRLGAQPSRQRFGDVVRSAWDKRGRGHAEPGARMGRTGPDDARPRHSPPRPPLPADPRADAGARSHPARDQACRRSITAARSSARSAARCWLTSARSSRREHPVVIYAASGTGAWEAALVNTLSAR